MATNPSIPAGVDPYKVMRCSVCGNSCRVRCLERHIPDFACHNKDCILHSESVHADTVDGVIYPWKNAPQPDPDFEPAPYGTRKQGRDQGRDRDQDRGWQSPRFKTDSDRDHKPFDKEYSQNPFANTHRQDTFDDKRRTDRFDDDFRDGQDRGRSRKNHRAHADPFGDDPFGDDSFGNDPFNDDFFDRARERMAGLGGDPFADKSLMSFGGAPPRSRRPTRDNPPGMDSFMAGCFEDIDRMTKDMGKRFGMTSLFGKAPLGRERAKPGPEAYPRERTEASRRVPSPTRRAPSPPQRAPSPPRRAPSPTRRAPSPSRRGPSPAWTRATGPKDGRYPGKPTEKADPYTRGRTETGRRVPSPTRRIPSPSRRAPSPSRYGPSPAWTRATGPKDGRKPGQNTEKADPYTRGRTEAGRRSPSPPRHNPTAAWARATGPKDGRKPGQPTEKADPYTSGRTGARRAPSPSRPRAPSPTRPRAPPPPPPRAPSPPRTRASRNPGHNDDRRADRAREDRPTPFVYIYTEGPDGRVKHDFPERGRDGGRDRPKPRR